MTQMELALRSLYTDLETGVYKIYLSVKETLGLELRSDLQR